MKTTDFVKMALENSKNFAFGLINDMKDSPLTQPTPNGGNHPTWVLGHLVRAESDLWDGFILGKPNRFPELENCAMGSTTSTNAADYASIDELFAKHEQIRADAIGLLNTLSDTDLDKPSHAPRSSVLRLQRSDPVFWRCRTT